MIVPLIKNVTNILVVKLVAKLAVKFKESNSRNHMKRRNLSQESEQATKRQKKLQTPETNSCDQNIAVDTKVSTPQTYQKENALFLTFDILWYVIKNEFIDYVCFTALLGVNKSIKEYASFIKVTDHVDYQHYTWLLNMCDSVKKFVKYIEWNDPHIREYLEAKNPDIPCNYDLNKLLSTCGRRGIFESLNIKKYESFLKVIRSIHLNNAARPEIDPIEQIIKMINNISSSDILKGYRIITSIIGGYSSPNNPTACGTYGMSVFYAIINQLLEKKWSGKTYRITSLDDKSHMICKFIKARDNNPVSYVYQFNIYHCQDSSKYFPGHCFVLIKIGPDKYILTQSYIDDYTHKKHIDVLNLQAAIEICKMYMCICKKTIIDQQFIDHWKRITHVNISDFFGYTFPVCEQRVGYNVNYMEFIY